MERIQTTIEKLEREIALVAFPDSAPPPPPQAGDATWKRLPYVKVDRERAARERVVTIDRLDAANFRFDILRTKILKVLRQNNWTSVAITSPTPGCGKTLVSLNLAFSFANLKDCRTVLVDLDLRRPQVGKVLGLEKMSSMERFLKGEAPIEETFVRCGDTIAVGANAHPASYTAELLQSPDTSAILKNLRDRMKPDVLIFDLPPMLANDDVLSLLPNVDCVILVAAAEHSTFSEVDLCERTLAQEANLLGVVLNKCQYAPEEYGY